jgi:3-oxoacyl-[acyl-carrier-protein] synthase III
MGAIITSTALCLDQDTRSCVELAARAGEDCIRRSGKETKDISLLINVGVFRDCNIMEPAMASLIQKRMGVPLYLEGAPKHTFAFDIINGAGGMLNAARAAGALLANGDAKCALILGSDVHPSMTQMKNFPYRSIGAAMLLEWSDIHGKGFRSIDMKTSDSDYIGASASFNVKKCGVDSIRTMNFDYEPDYTERLTSFTVESVIELLNHYRKDYSVDPSKIKFVSTHPWKGFAQQVAASAGLNGYPVDCLYEKNGNPNSSALTVSYHDAYSAGRLKEGDNVLFLAASAGLNVTAGFYGM